MGVSVVELNGLECNGYTKIGSIGIDSTGLEWIGHMPIQF